MIVSIIYGVGIAIFVRDGVSSVVVAPAFGGAVGIGGNVRLVAIRIRVGRDVRVAVRFGAEESFLPGAVVGISDSIAVGLGDDERTILIVERRRAGVGVGIGSEQAERMGSRKTENRPG